MGRSGSLFSRLTEVQSDAASAIHRTLRGYSAGKAVTLETATGSKYEIKTRSSGNHKLDIKCGDVVTNEFTTNPIELISILETIELNVSS